ncbi:MAG: DNA polymerase I [Actinobacteria bacterium]|nr:DNA polymerase I [Actinomycetota bacterium]MCZ6630474.1 DNA polymerase I [Actinomycetota bacterium]
MPTLALIDGNSIAYRAFYALPEDLATKSGQVTNAVFGFTRMLIRLLKDFHPDGIAVAWDVSRKTFRTEAYPEYKAQREKAPDHFRGQLPLMDEVLRALQINQLRMEGFEADDIIASLTRNAVEDGWEVLIVTGDRDAFQLVGGQVQVVYTRRGISDIVLADDAYIQEKYGITPSQYVEYASLRGDNSDNLPGVPGVGEKTASRLIAEHGTVDGVYAAIGDMTPRLRENLAASREQVFLNLELMDLVDDLDLGYSTTDFETREWDRNTVKDLFDSLEFHSMWNDLEQALPSTGGATEILDVEAELVTTADRISDLANRDTLVVGLVSDGGGPFGLSVSTGPGKAVVIPLEDAGPILVEIGSGAIGVIGHDLKSIARALLDQGHDLIDTRMDTALAAYILNPSSRSYDLAEIAERVLGVEVVSPDDEDATGMLPFDSGPDMDLEGRRVEAVRRLADQLGKELFERDEADLFIDFELPLVPVLARMEHAGIGVDRAYLEQMGKDLRSRIAKLESKIHQLAGEAFNVNSTDQLRTILFDKLGLPISKKTSTGKPSTDASVLKKLDHPLVDALLEYRELEKLRSTYVDGYLPLIDPDGRIRTRFNQMAAATGRLSSDSPNLQNIPVRSESGKDIRRAFIAGEGNLFLVADYSQIELRVLAHMSADPFLTEAFQSGLDIHTATAARVWDVPTEEVSTQQRRTAKMINFGLLYGMEAFGLADRLGISREEAQEHVDAYFSQFHHVKEYMASMVTAARNDGYTTTLFGRRRYLPELKSDNFRIRQMGERMALNAPVQGSAADIIKKAMIDLDSAIRAERMASTMLLQIHDELIIEVPEDESVPAEKLVVETMEGVAGLDVPLKVDVGWGPDLASVKA